MSFSISGAVDVVRWHARWDLVLLATLLFPVSSSEDSTIRVEAMLSCSLLCCGSLLVAESGLSGAGSRASTLILITKANFLVLTKLGLGYEDAKFKSYISYLIKKN